jgi:hypothetical protein
MAIGVGQIGPLAVAYLHKIMLQQVDSLMNHAPTNLTVPAESMTVIALILMGVLAKAIRNLSKRLSQYRFTLQSDSFDLHLQTKQHLLQQELLQQDQQEGDDGDGRSENDDGGISRTNQRPQF